MKEHLFTPLEANKRLPLVRKIVGEILERGRKLRRLLKESEGKEVPVECLNLQAQMEGLMDELQDLGCSYKDWNFEAGLVDFPSVIDGQKVLLCWRSDEPDVRWYHGYHDGYSGRKPVPEHVLTKPFSKN